MEDSASEDVLTVYEAFKLVQNALKYGAFGSLKDAVDFIEMIDSYDEMYEGDRSFIESFFMDITDVYADAEAFVTDKENNIQNNNTQNNNTQSNNTQDNNTEKTTDSTETKTITSPKTGDDSNVWMCLVLVIVCGGMICGIIAKEQKRRTVK